MQRLHFEEKKWVAECGRRIDSHVGVKPREGMKSVLNILPLRCTTLLLSAVDDAFGCQKLLCGQYVRRIVNENTGRRP